MSSTDLKCGSHVFLICWKSEAAVNMDSLTLFHPSDTFQLIYFSVIDLITYILGMLHIRDTSMVFASYI